MNILKKYFNSFTDKQLLQFEQLKQLILEWNNKINVISRKDTDAFDIHHLLHSLCIAKLINFTKGTQVLDIGTGGGFPGLPLAIAFPDTHFTLNDSIAKKIKVVEDTATRIGLENVTCINARAEDINGTFDFIVSRAVTALPKFLSFTKDKISNKNINQLPNGIIYLKGGNYTDELQKINLKHKVIPISTFFEEDFFQTKDIVLLTMDYCCF